MSLTTTRTASTPLTGSFTLAGTLRWADLRVRTVDGIEAATVTLTATCPRAEHIAEATSLITSDNRIEFDVPESIRTVLSSTSLLIQAEVPAGTVLEIGCGSGSIQALGVYSLATVQTGSGSLRLERAETAHVTSGSGGVTLDRCAAAQVRIGSGTLAIGEVDSLEVRGGSGSVSVGSLSGEGSIRTGSGRQQVDSLSGQADLDLGSGSLRLGEVRGTVVARTGSGSIRVERLLEGRLQTTTSSGSQKIGVPHGTALQVDAESRAGRVRSALDEVAGATGYERTAAVLARSGTGSIAFTRAA